MRNLFLVVLVTALVSACGFHLQGSRPLPAALSKIHINYVQPFDVVEPPLVKHLKAEAESRGGWVVATGDAETAELRIDEMDHDNDILSISGATGRRLETMLSTTVEFELLKNGEVLLPEQRLVVFREILYERDQVIAKEYEHEEARESMHKELARLIFLRLETQLAANTP